MTERIYPAAAALLLAACAALADYTSGSVSLLPLHDKVQLWANGPYWATTNVGADEPWEYGLYFWWGDTVGYRREGDAWVASDGSSSNYSFEEGSTPTYDKSIDTLAREGWVVQKDGAYVLAPAHDAAQVYWGDSWRMPTYQELNDLDSNCDWTPITRNGVNGCIVRGRGAFSEASIFLPCAGFGHGPSLLNAGWNVIYWASVPYWEEGYRFSWHLHFSLNNGQRTDMGCHKRLNGFPIRPVKGVAE